MTKIISMKHTTAFLSFITLVCISLILLFIIHTLSAKRIQTNQSLAALQLIQSIVPANATTQLTLKHLEHIQKHGNTHIKITNTTTPDHKQYITLIQSQANGYASMLTTITSILTTQKHNQTPKHTLIGIRVIPPQQETPGLGDVIMLHRSSWITQFNNQPLVTHQSRAADQAQTFTAQFDHITGATISTQAVLKSLSTTLTQYYKNRSLQQSLD